MMRFPRCIAFAITLFAGSQLTFAQQINTSIPPPPPVEVTPAPVFDPFHAEKSMEIGAFYMKRHNYDAAIDRFEEATRYEPTLARPWALLGEVHEKKHDYAKAI